MNTIVPSLYAPNALKAISFYKKVFNAKLESHNPLDSTMAQGMELPEDFDYSKSTIHAEISINGDLLFISDDFGNTLKANGRVEVTIIPSSLNMIESFYNNAVKEGSEVIVKLEKQFWGDYFCRIIDPFGIGWQLNFSPPKKSEEAQLKNSSKKEKKSPKKSSTKK